MSDKIKTKKVKCKNRVANGTMKNKPFRAKEVPGGFVPRDCAYLLTGPGFHALDDVTEVV